MKTAPGCARGADAFYERKDKMKKTKFTVLIAVLIAVLTLAACEAPSAEAGSTGGSSEILSTGQGGEPSASESAGESGGNGEQSSEEAEDEALPPVEGPDEDGKFPAISRDIYEKYIINSYDEKRGAKRPKDSEITPFLENELAKKYLKSKFPNISDWKVLFEYSCYRYDSYSYDPYTYSFCGQYFPQYMIILATEQGESFDRVFIKGGESISLEYDSLENAYIPQYRYNCVMSKTTEDYLGCGNFDGAEAVYNVQNSDPVIWVPEASATLYINYDELVRVKVKGANAPLAIERAYDSRHWYFSDDVRKIKPPESRAGDIILSIEREDGKSVLAYYDASEQTVTDFENITGNEYCRVVFASDTIFTYRDIEASAYYFYDFSDGADPTKCILALRGNGGELAGGAFEEYRAYDVEADRKYDDRYLIIYADTGGERFYIAYCSVADGILTQITLEEKPKGYIGDYSVRGGIAYISYNDGNGSGFKHYAVDLRPDRDHTLQANAW